MSYSDDDADQAVRNWIRDTREARSHCREVLRELDPNVPNDVVVDPPQMVALLHTVVLDFHRHIAPKHRVLSDPNSPGEPSLWEEPLVEVEVPPSAATFDAGQTNVWGDISYQNPVRQVEWKTVDVTLASLLERWDYENESRITVRARDGPGATDRVVEAVTETVFLPPKASKAVFTQLNKCMDHLGWVADAATIDLESEPLNPGGIGE